MIEEELDIQAAVMLKQLAAQERRKKNLINERTKLLEAHYADAVPLDLLKSEQQRIADEIQKADELIEASGVRHEKVLANLQRAIAQAERWHLGYRIAGPDVRRELNQSVFTQILVSHDRPTNSEFAEPFKTLFSNEVAAATIDKADEDHHNPPWLTDELRAIYKSHAERKTWPGTPTKSQNPPLARRGLSNCLWCPGRDLNPYEGFPSGGFKPPASADSATRASS